MTHLVTNSVPMSNPAAFLSRACDVIRSAVISGREALEQRRSTRLADLRTSVKALGRIIGEFEDIASPQPSGIDTRTLLSTNRRLVRFQLIGGQLLDWAECAQALDGITPPAAVRDLREMLSRLAHLLTLAQPSFSGSHADEHAVRACLADIESLCASLFDRYMTRARELDRGTVCLLLMAHNIDGCADQVREILA